MQTLDSPGKHPQEGLVADEHEAIAHEHAG